jgi:trk system potassium uptake protein TrkH
MKVGIVAKTLGVLSVLIGAIMALLMFYAWVEWKVGEQTAEEWEAVLALGYSAAISIGVGALQVLGGARSQNKIMRREGIVIVGLSWVQVGMLGGLPYIFSHPGLDPIAAFFESVSGFTTTGSSVMTDIEAYPRAILMWRSVTQWLGGIGILVVFVAVLSFLGAGTKSLVSQESSLNLSDSGTSRIKDLAWVLLKVYVVLTSVCGLGLWLLGMSPFEAICHSMTTMATGGFSPKNASIAHYQSVGIEIWLGIFMFLASLGFTLYVFIARGRWKRVRAEEEAKYYALLLTCVFLLVAWNVWHSDLGLGWAGALRSAFFNVLSISSTTGFGSGDYDQWPLFSKMLLAMLMFIGGCAGSTAGGVKMNRVILFKRIALRELVQSFRPSQVFRIKLNGVAPDERVFVTTSFFIALCFAICGAAMLLVSLFEPQLDSLSVLGCVFGTTFNIGPGFAAVGPTDNYSFLGSDTLVLLSFLMILGRLEFFALLVLFVPSLWKRY